jgi:hypothetical protein
MLIKIDDSVVDILSSNGACPSEIINAIELLAYARREGKHSLVISRRGIEGILSSNLVSDLSKTIFNKLMAESVNFASYMSCVTTYVEVSYPCLIPSRLKHDGKEIIKLPPKFFDDTVAIQKTILLSEDLEDIKFYILIAKTCCHWLRIPSELAYEARGGGGNRTGETYKSIQQYEKRFCMCIVDSDKLYSSSPLGSTAKRVISEDKAEHPHSNYKILNVSEVENLIPFEFLTALFGGEPDKQSGLKLLERVLSSEIAEAIKYLDIKKGLHLKKIFACPDSNTQAFWESVVAKLPHDLMQLEQWCIENKLCQEQEKKASQKSPCKCRVNVGLSDKTLSRLLEWLSEKDYRSLTKNLDPVTRPEWEEIGEIIISWCFARPKIIT